MLPKNIIPIMKDIVLFVVICAVLLVFVVTIYGEQNATPLNNNYNENSQFPHQQWTCINNKCQKLHDHQHSSGSTLTTCKMLCGDSLPPLWPKPKQITILNKNTSIFMKEHITLSIHSPEVVKNQVEIAANIFLTNLVAPEGTGQYRLYDGEQQLFKLNLHVKEPNLKPTTDINESYTLYSQKMDDFILVNIFAPNYFGIRHALETLSQLIWYDHLFNRFRILHDVKIIDEPSFEHRGILIDVSRNYFPIELLRKVVDGMAASKLNVLHLHISDVESFPLELPNNGQLVKNGAYDYDLKYSSENIENLVNYAKLRGIRTIMEIDAPSHITPEAWPRDEILCNDPDIFKTTLNPDNPNTLNTLQNIYSDLFRLGTDTETFHIGDDEVITECWKQTDSAKKENSDVYSLWAKFTNKMMERLKIANNGTIPKNIVLWSSPLTDKYIKLLANQQDLVVQFWFGQFKHLMENGYKIIFSTVGQWYLDCGFGPWKKSQNQGSCDPYTDWRKFYKYRPWKDHPNRLGQVLGGEVCLWSEEVSADDLETRLWPRAAAFAERVWSDPLIFDQDDVFKRIDFHSSRLRERGFRVAAIWPQICSQYPEKC